MHWAQRKFIPCGTAGSGEWGGDGVVKVVVGVVVVVAAVSVVCGRGGGEGHEGPRSREVRSGERGTGHGRDEGAMMRRGCGHRDDMRRQRWIAIGKRRAPIAELVILGKVGGVKNN